MIVSVNWLKKFTDITMPVDELATLIGARLVEIEETVDLSKKYRGIIISKVVNVAKHPDADRLSVCKIDDGGKNQAIERDDDGYVQVVCGAPNVREGMFVAWLAPGEVVPASFSDAEPFRLEARELRGVMSHGMLASATELDLYEDNEGILDIVSDEIKPGDDFAEVFELNDTLLDIENKSLTHRPDCFGLVGLAREIAAIQGNKFDTPDWLNDTDVKLKDLDKETNIKISVEIQNTEISERYQAVVLTGADQKKQSSILSQSYLARINQKPISSVVDITNSVMFESGQPLHAFDYDKFVALGDNEDQAEVIVRLARDGEKLALIDGREIDLSDQDIIICSGQKPVALAGAMGGMETQIDETTRNVLLECATFNLYSLRATQMRHGIFSEAITRFTKGIPAELARPVIVRAAQQMIEQTGAKPGSEIIESYPNPQPVQAIDIETSKVKQVLGKIYKNEEIIETLENVGFAVNSNGDSLSINAPYWRSDIKIAEDIIEEVGRLNGFDNIEPSLPVRDFVAHGPTEFDKFRSKVRSMLVRAGANEVLTYSFIHGDDLQKAGQEVDNSYKITNSISPQLQYYRQTLTPSLMKLVHPNIKNGYNTFSVFEFNKVHNKKYGLNKEDVPNERQLLGFVFASKNDKPEAPYYEAKRYLDYLGRSIGIEFVYSQSEQSGSSLAAPFEGKRSALIGTAGGDDSLGVVGEYRNMVSKNFKLPKYSAGFEIDVEALFRAMKTSKRIDQYSPLSRYPSVERDICVRVDSAATYQSIVETVNDACDDETFKTTIQPIDIFSTPEASTKNITVRLTFTPHDRTMTKDDASVAMQKLEDAITTKLGAVII